MANGVVFYLLARMTRGVFPPVTEWMHAAPESAEASGDPWVWKEEKEGAHVWRVGTNKEQDELDALAKSHEGWPVVRGGRVEVRCEDLPVINGRKPLTRAVSPKEVFEQLEKKHLA